MTFLCRADACYSFRQHQIKRDILEDLKSPHRASNELCFYHFLRQVNYACISSGFLRLPNDATTHCSRQTRSLITPKILSISLEFSNLRQQKYGKIFISWFTQAIKQRYFRSSSANSRLNLQIVHYDV